jgi:hypothetical protein
MNGSDGKAKLNVEPSVQKPKKDPTPTNRVHDKLYKTLPASNVAPLVDEEDLENPTTKWLFTTEFNQMFKKLERVKENFNTHKKFMDIVKL